MMARRGVGIKEPKGAVKTSIILLLADKPKSTFENIREYLKETYGITNTTGIRNHIKWLVENRLVSEKKRLMGSTGYYGINLHYLKTNFETFKRVFLYLKEMHRENELIETRYYKSYVKSPDFKAKFPVNIFKENTIQLYDYVIKQECLNGLFEQTFGEGKPSANILSKQFIDILFEYDVDEVADRLNELSNDEPLKTLLMRYKNFTDFINTVVVNEKERPQVVEMALISPSVINYILKPTFIDPGLAYTGPLFIMGFHTLDGFSERSMSRFYDFKALMRSATSR
jgi:hypothetical protein